MTSKHIAAGILALDLSLKKNKSIGFYYDGLEEWTDIFPHGRVEAINLSVYGLP
jgi:hypothetical protein